MMYDICLLLSKKRFKRALWMAEKRMYKLVQHNECTSDEKMHSMPFQYKVYRAEEALGACPLQLL